MFSEAGLFFLLQCPFQCCYLNVYRNRVRTPEERKHPLVKKIEADRKERGILKKKEIIAYRNRALAKAKKNNKPKKGEFSADLWEGIHFFFFLFYGCFKLHSYKL